MEVRNFSKLGDAVPIPNLAEVQTRSYEEFLQLDIPSKDRRNQGLEAILREIFPIRNSDGTLALEYDHYHLGTPSHTIEECRHLRLTYSRPLYLHLRCVGREVVAEDVYIADIPMMIGGGEFIINGAERVIVAQIHRAPGIDFAVETGPGDRKTYSCRIVPERGMWIEFSIGAKELLYARLGRSGRIPGLWPIRALMPQFGSNEGVLALFYERETFSLDRSSRDLIGRYLAGDIVDSQTGKTFASAGEPITSSLLEAMKRTGMTEVTVLKGVDDPLILRTISADPVRSSEEALQQIYQRFRPGEPFILERACQFFATRLADPAHYSLGKVGRFRINRKLQLDAPETEMLLRPEDLVAAVRYLIRLRKGLGSPDDIDHLGNRLLRPAAHLMAEHIREGFLLWRGAVLERLVSRDGATPSPRAVANNGAVMAAITEFFSQNELSQVVDQHNPLAQLQHERRLSALGPGGLNRKRAGFEVRDVHKSHYGRICPIETPEGPNIGLISSLSLFAKLDEYNFLVTPYQRVHKGRLTGEIVYLRADQEEKYRIAPLSPVFKNGAPLDTLVLARLGDEFKQVRLSEVDYVDVSPKQLVGLSASLIPFLEHNDANRALMGSNMQRQAIPLLRTEQPLVATGMEPWAAHVSSLVVRARQDGVVEQVDSQSIRIGDTIYTLQKFLPLNERTCQNQKPIVKIGERVRRGQVIADGASTKNGELSLGFNVLVAFMMWDGYNFEDAIVVSERLVREDRCTSIHIEEFEACLRETQVGREEFTRDIPNISPRLLANLDADGLIHVGARVRPGDILVGKVTPKAKSILAPEDQLLRAIFGRSGEEVRNESLEVPPGTEGVVIRVARYSRKTHLTAEDRRRNQEKAAKMRALYDQEIARLYRSFLERLRALAHDPENSFPPPSNSTDRALAEEADRFLLDLDLIRPEHRDEARFQEREFRDKLKDLSAEREAKLRRLRVGDELPPGVLELVRVSVAMRRRLSVGDKLAGRHGNKGVVARIVPEEDMPFLPDGRTIEIILNPLGVPSRMNIGQILETHLGWAAHELGFRAITPVFDGATEDEIQECLKEAGLPQNGKTILYDGRTGEPFEQEATVGYIYMMKLNHLVEDKLHARATGPYSLITQQPLGGKSRLGGQRLGEMEVWALEAYGASHLLQEMLTVKSDDAEGRTRIYESMVKGRNILEAGVPQSFEVLESEVRGLALNIRRESSRAREERVST